MIDDLIPWLRSVLDDRERKALAAQAEIAAWGGSWTAYTDQLAHRSTIDADAVADHIAEHDPTGVLAEVDAKRRILDWLEDDAGFDLPATKTQAMSRDEWNRVFTARTTIKMLALPYADRPGYREEWKP